MKKLQIKIINLNLNLLIQYNQMVLIDQFNKLNINIIYGAKINNLNLIMPGIIVSLIINFKASAMVVIIQKYLQHLDLFFVALPAKIFFQIM